MNKVFPASSSTVFCGIDVSARSLSVALIRPDGSVSQREFANSASGHKALLGWLGKLNAMVRVSLEATGVYSLDLALALDAAAGIEVAVLNPKLANRFAQTLCRSVTDAAAAVVLAEYSQRMPFTPWQRPGIEELRLRTISRYIEALVVDLAELKNRLHAAESASTTPRAIIVDLKQAQAAPWFRSQQADLEIVAGRGGDFEGTAHRSAGTPGKIGQDRQFRPGDRRCRDRVFPLG